MKKKIIEKIKTIIDDYGSFGIGEVQADCSPCVNSLGEVVGLAEYFSDDVTIEIYHDEVNLDSYTMKYEELKKDVLEQILEYAKQYKADQEEENE